MTNYMSNLPYIEKQGVFYLDGLIVDLSLLNE